MRVLSEILRGEGWTVQFDILPWARCLHVVETGEYALTMNVSYSKERAVTYQYSLPYVQSHIHYYYSRERFATAPVKHLDDLKALRVCGINGYNYAYAGLASTQMDLGSADFSSVFNKMKRNRCDVFVHSIEDIQGQGWLGRDFLADPQLAHALLPNVGPVPSYFILSRKDPRMSAVLSLINEGISRAQRNRKLLQWVKQEADAAKANLQTTSPEARH